MTYDQATQLLDLVNVIASNQIYLACAVLGLIAAVLVAVAWKG